MIRAIIFDLDGVLVDADKWHFEALNAALLHYDHADISWQEHLTIYKGLPTLKKLEILTKRKGLPNTEYGKISIYKQDRTAEFIKKFAKYDPEKISMMGLLLRRGLRLAVCSNAVHSTIMQMLEASGLDYRLDVVLGNDDVDEPKPNPEIYLKAFEQLQLKPEECVIVEDSSVGKQAAHASGAYVCEVDGPEDVNFYKVLASIKEAQTVNIVVPAAGQGKRFAEEGYVYPKPLINVRDTPMIDWVLHSVKDIGRNIVLMQEEHIDKYSVYSILRDTEIFGVNGVTEGAACTVLLAKDLIDNNNELLIINSDQYLAPPIIKEFLIRMEVLRADAGMITFDSDNKKWSYAREEDGKVVEVAEKNPISRNATCGVYYYRRGKDFVRWAEKMMAKNIRVNNEFYVCPVFNEGIAEGAKIYVHAINPHQMHGLGTPEDLDQFLSDINHEDFI